MEPRRAWSLIAVGDDRQYAGNEGYSDEPRVYKYDSNVANHRNVGMGDLVIVRDRSKVIGIARIERIDSQAGKKTISRCPECGTTAIKERRSKLPRYRCNNTHEFEKPRLESADVTLFEAHYAESYIPVPDAVPVSHVKAAALRPSDQLSIEEIDISELEKAFLKAYPTTRNILAEFYQSMDIDAAEALYGDKEPVGDTPSFAGSLADTRTSVLRQIRLRRGQSQFRSSLVSRYGGACVVTGCKLLDVLEAAHIWPYRGSEDHDPSNGLLLRADMHILFDLNMMAIEPHLLTVHFIPPIAALDDYSRFHDCRLRAVDRPAFAPLAHRWTIFRNLNSL
jgi:putative restriction endonuclease